MPQNAKPIIAYNNLAVAATAIAASTEHVEYPKENLLNKIPSDRWCGTGAGDQYVEFDLGAPAAVSCVGIVGHDLFTQGAANVAFKYWSGAAWVDCLTAFTPASDKAIFKTFTEVTRQLFRLVIPAGYLAPPSIGVISFGPYLQFPRWCKGEFDPDAEESELESNRSVTGEYLGSVFLYSTRKCSMKFSPLTFAWVDTYLKPMWEALKGGDPFFLAWDITNHPAETYYAVLSKPSFKCPYSAASRSTEIAAEWQGE